MGETHFDLVLFIQVGILLAGLAVHVLDNGVVSYELGLLVDLRLLMR